MKQTITIPYVRGDAKTGAISVLNMGGVFQEVTVEVKPLRVGFTKVKLLKSGEQWIVRFDVATEGWAEVTFDQPRNVPEPAVLACWVI